MSTQQDRDVGRGEGGDAARSEGMNSPGTRVAPSSEQELGPETVSLEVSDFGAPTPAPEGPAYRLVSLDERARVLLAASFVAIFAVTIIASYAIVMFAPDTWGQGRELLELLLPAETALLGSAVGFYFGSRSESGRR